MGDGCQDFKKTPFGSNYQNFIRRIEDLEGLLLFISYKVRSFFIYSKVWIDTVIIFIHLVPDTSHVI